MHNLTKRQIKLATELARRIQNGELDESFHAVWGTGLSPGQKPIVVWGDGEWSVIDESFGDFHALAEEGLLRMVKDGKYPFPKGVKGYAPTDEHYSCTSTAKLFAIAQRPISQPVIADESDAHTPYVLDIFISHSSQDIDLAELFIELIRQALDVPQPAIRCTSVDGYRLPTGVPTDEQIKREVKNSRCFLALLTPSSLNSSYVLFELGARWGTQLPLFPILAKGITASDLWTPLSSLNAVSCYTASQIHQILGDISSIIGRPVNQPATYDRYLQRLIPVAAALSPSTTEDIRESQPTQSGEKIAAKMTSGANELFELILAEPDAELRGIVEIGASLEPGKTYFFPRLQYAGNPFSMKTRHFKEAISELLSQQRLFEPEHDESTNTFTYEYRSNN